MAPKALARGVAAKAEAKAALAGKAKAQSAGRGMGEGIGPRGTLRPAKPVPEATRRSNNLSFNNLLLKAMPQAFSGHRFIGCRVPKNLRQTNVRHVFT